MNCRDCSKEADQINVGAKTRSDICNSCWGLRKRVIEALQAGKMSVADFHNYQRTGLRTKRLLKMGYEWLLVIPDIKADREKAEADRDGKKAAGLK